MRAITWLQVSDIHMRLRDAWSQDVVLKAMSTSIASERAKGCAFDFLLVTGDLAFSGKEAEYRLVADFLDAIGSAAGVPCERIFCVPGNHDIDRDKQTLCFHGARHKLVSATAVDAVLAPDDNLATLGLRQQGYRAFQASYFGHQSRSATPDGLAYVSTLEFDSVVVAIIGLNSAWLAEGGASDHGHLLIGERQLISAISIARSHAPHIVLAMSHHPLHLLHEFDRVAAMNRIIAACDFFHCGHLHAPEARGAGFDAKACLTVAAGATFETREADNSYAVVRLDLDEGMRTLTTTQYDPHKGSFDLSRSETFPFALDPAATCELKELAETLLVDVDTAPFAYYLAALLLERKSEVPMVASTGYVFAAVAVLEAKPVDELCGQTIAFLRFRNALRLFANRMPLAQLIAERGQAVKAYGSALRARCTANGELAARVRQHDADIRNMIAAQPVVAYGVEVLNDLAAAQDWALLRQQAARQLASANPDVKAHARRMLGVALANSADDSGKREAVQHYRLMVEGNDADAADRLRLVTLLHNVGDAEEAKRLLLESLPLVGLEARNPFFELGNRIVSETGDKEFRGALETEKKKGRQA